MELRLELLRLELFVELELLILLRLDQNIIPAGGKLNKRVFYYSVELFYLILLDYSVWKCIRRIFFIFQLELGSI
jgi:hypothetical protein